MLLPQYECLSWKRICDLETRSEKGITSKSRSQTENTISHFRMRNRAVAQIYNFTLYPGPKFAHDQIYLAPRFSHHQINPRPKFTQHQIYPQPKFTQKLTQHQICTDPNLHKNQIYTDPKLTQTQFYTKAISTHERDQ